MRSPIPELVFASSRPDVSRAIAQRVRAGQLRKLMPRVYTSTPPTDDVGVVRRHLYELIGRLYPGSMLAYRSGLEFVPTGNGRLYLHGLARRPVRWPGVTLYFSEAPAALPDDRALATGLVAPSSERALLENLRPVRALLGEARVLSPRSVEERLVKLLDASGQRGLNALRDRARAIARELAWGDSFDRLERLIAALLGTGLAGDVISEAGRARVLGLPYDGARLELFRTLQSALLQTRLPAYPTRTNSLLSYRNLAFYESYFSNFIEGTEFTVEEAERIVFAGEDIPTQREDSHDVRAVYELCSSPELMRLEAPNATEFADLIRGRHARMLAQRPQKRPGEFKRRANRAGDTEFVHPDVVAGTLAKGFEILQTLTKPIERALFLMFLVSEVHPFDDGNGRLARLLMNAELSQADQSKLIVPTVYREDYLLNLRALTRRGNAAAYIRMMQRIWGYTAALVPDTMSGLRAQLERTNAFKLSSEHVILFPEGV